ncbi:MAG: DUF3445 domain-containing protein [Rhizobiaceae bacterium]
MAAVDSNARTGPKVEPTGRMRHTPYDGSHPLFRIGLKPLDLHDWIEVDEHLDFYLKEKQRLAALYPGRTFMAEAGSEAAQREVRDLIAAHVVRRFPAIYRRDGNVIDVNGRPVGLDGDEPKLAIAAKLVQEDLLVLGRDEAGWRLIAGSLSFPSSWSLGEKFGRAMEDIHAPVPGFGAGTRNAAMINRVFDNLKPDQPVWRMNWSVYADDELFHDDRTAEHLKKRDLTAGVFLRVEYQTLRLLPESGRILFTVRVHVDPMARLQAHPDRRRISGAFAEQLAGLSAEQLAYKGLTAQRDLLLERLRAMAETTTGSGALS